MSQHPKVIFQQVYDFNSLADLARDVEEAIDADFNPKMDGISGEFKGTFTVNIVYVPGEDE